VHKYLHPRFIDQFENDARVQVRFHLSAAYFWLFSMVGVLFVPTFKGNFAALLIMEVSLYANFSTEYGALAAAQTNVRATKNERKIG
jgi:hypothetical protein